MTINYKIIFIPLFLLLWKNSYGQTPASGELLAVHSVTTLEMNAVINPFAGSLLYNADEKSIYFYTGALWKRLKPNGSETILNAANTLTVSGNGTAPSPYILSQ